MDLENGHRLGDLRSQLGSHLRRLMERRPAGIEDGTTKLAEVIATSVAEFSHTPRHARLLSRRAQLSCTWTLRDPTGPAVACNGS